MKLFFIEKGVISLTNCEKISENHKLKQNKDIIKYNKNYTLDYQFMALENNKICRIPFCHDLNSHLTTPF